MAAARASGAEATAVDQAGLANVLAELKVWLEAELAAAVGDITATVQAAWNAVNARDVGGDVSGSKRTTTVGGGGDTVTEWLLVAGLIAISAGLSGGLVYGYVLRPLGLRAKSPAERAATRARYGQGEAERQRG